MSTIISETIVTKYVQILGSELQNSVLTALYRSDIGHLFFGLGALFAMFSLGLALHNQRPPKKTLWFFFAFACTFPYQGAPVAFHITNALARSTSSVFEEAVLKVVSDRAAPASNSSLPPGHVMEMIAAAATTTISDDKLRNEILLFTRMCLPVGLMKNRSYMDFDDIFSFSTRIITSADGTRSLAVVDERIDQRSLENADYNSNTSCFEALTNIRTALAEHVSEKPLHITNRAVLANSSDPQDTENWRRNWEAQSPYLHSFAVNLQMAHAAINLKNDPVALISHLDNKISPTIYEAQEIAGGITKVRRMLGGVFDAMSKDINSRKTWTLGAKLEEVRERLEMLPYDLASIQMVMKAIAPVFFLTLIFGTSRFAAAWIGGWVVLTFYPAMVTMLRSVTNSFLVAKLGINDFNPDSWFRTYKGLAYGVDLKLAESLLADFAPQALSLLNMELAIMSALSALILGGSVWLGGRAGDGAVSGIGSYLVSGAVGLGLRATTGLVTGGASALTQSTTHAHQTQNTSNRFNQINSQSSGRTHATTAPHSNQNSQPFEPGSFARLINPPKETIK